MNIYSQLFKKDETRLDVYKDVQRELHVQEAVTQVLNYLNSKGREPVSFRGDFEYEYLAEEFEKRHDGNVADNTQWQTLIDEYAKANDIFS